MVNLLLQFEIFPYCSKFLQTFYYAVEKMVRLFVLLESVLQCSNIIVNLKLSEKGWLYLQTWKKSQRQQTF